MWEPAAQPLLRCVTCRIWYHRECSRVEGMLAYLPDTQRQQFPPWLQATELSSRNANVRFWAALRALPLQRTHPELHLGQLTTAESVIAGARALEVRPRVPREWIREQVRSSHPAMDSDEEDDVLSWIDTLVATIPHSRLVYVCPRGHYM